MDKIKNKYNLLCSGHNSIDIYEHLPTLYNYAKECNSIFETGVRGCISSWAFLYGLLDSQLECSKRLYLNDIDVCNIDELLNVAKEFTHISVNYEWKNNLLLNFDETFDITFIDTWHVYGQLKRELDKFSKITNKYIIMHDTTVDEIYGETIRSGFNADEQSRVSGFPLEEINKGLWPAVEEFLSNNPEWQLKERFTNNNGLTILVKN